MNENKTTITVNRNLHKRLKMISVEKEKTLREIVEIALMDWASRYDIERMEEKGLDKT